MYRLPNRLRPIPLLGALALLVTSAMFFFFVSESFSQGAASRSAWQPAGLPGTTVHLLAVGRRHGKVAFAATEQGVYQLHGAIWQRGTAARGVWSVALSNDDRTIVAGDEVGDVFVSRNGGASWRHRRVASQGVYAVSIRPGDRHWLVAGGGQGLYLSRDGGLHWTRRLALPRSAGTAIAWKPGSTRVVFAGAVAGGPHGSTGVYISRDGGLTWRAFGHGLGSGGGIMSLLVLPSGQLFAGTMGHAIWSAASAGGSWHRVSSGMPVTNDHVAGIARVPGHPAAIYVGTLGQGVFRSFDDGKHWTNVSVGLPKSANEAIVLSLAYSPLRKTLYAGTIDGVYELANASAVASHSSRK